MPDNKQPDDVDEIDTKAEDEPISDDVFDQSDETDKAEKTDETEEASAEAEPDNEPEALQDDEKTIDAVDDIVEKESDTVLAAEDKELSKAFDEKHENWKQKIKRLYFQWWNNKKLRYGTFAGIGVFLLFVLLLPVTRYAILNTAGVRSKASISIYDQSTQLPIKNVQVSIGKSTVKTDSSGKANLKDVKLGRQPLIIQKRAFAESKKTITIGWGSNPLGNVEIKPVGAQYTFKVTDWLSGKPITDAEASSGEFDAAAAEDGTIILTIDANSDEDLDVQIKAKDYRTETIKLQLENKADMPVKMVAGRKSVFISKRSGIYDVYKVDVDGKNEELVLAGSGNENDSNTLLSHPTAEVAALVSTRGTIRNRDGYLLSTLTMVDVKNNESEEIAQSEEIRLVGWSGDRLVFIQVAAGASAPNPKRQRLMSFDYKKSEKTELASSNNFNDALLIGSDVYYAPGNLYNVNAVNHVFKQQVDGSNKTSILDEEAWNIFRASYNTLQLPVDQAWYQYKVGDSKLASKISPPNSIENISYTDSPDSKNSLWIDERDGKGALLLKENSTGGDKVLQTQAGLQAPVRWLNGNMVIYRVQTSFESADYVLNIYGGSAVKIRDVTRAQ